MSFGPVIGTGSYVIIKEEPVQTNDLTYNGNLQNAVWNYDITKMKIVEDPGDQKHADTYEAGFKPIKQYCWSDGTQKVKYFEWTIKPKEISAPVLTADTRKYTGDYQSPDISYDPVISEYGDDPNDIFTIEHLSEKIAGDYTISWAIKSKDYVWKVPDPAVKTAVWTITENQVAAPSVSDLIKTYNTQEQHPVISPASSSDWSISSGYFGTDAGQYTLVISLADKQSNVWATTNNNEDLTFTWSINQRIITRPAWTGTTFTYNNTLQGPEIANLPTAIYVDTVGNLKEINAGTHTIRFSLNKNTETVKNTVWSDGNNDTNDIVITYDINTLKIPIPAVTDSSKTYNTLTQYPGLPDMTPYADYLDITGNPEAVDAGNYDVFYTIKSDINVTATNVTWTDDDTGLKKISWQITKRQLTKPSLSSSSFVFGAKHVSVISYENNYNGLYMARSGDLTGFDVDDYETVYSLTKNTDKVTNVEWAGDDPTGTVHLPWHITKKSLTVPAQSGTLIYNTEQQTAVWNSRYDPDFMTVSGDTGVNATSYTAIFTSKYPGNAQFGNSNTAAAGWSIGIKVLTKPSLTGPPYTYAADTERTPVRNNEDLTYMTRTGDISGTDAGTYTITYTLSKNTNGVINTKWEDNSSDQVDLTWTINKAALPYVRTLPTSLEFSNDNYVKSLSIQRPGDGAITVHNNYPVYVSVRKHDEELYYIDALKDTTSPVELTVSVAEGTNYKASTSSTNAVVPVTITGMTVILPVNSTDIVFTGRVPYTGDRVIAEGSMFSGYDPNTMTISGNTGTAINDYTAVITCKEGYKFKDNLTSVEVPWSVVESRFAVIDDSGKGNVSIDHGSCTEDNLSIQQKRFGTSSFYCDGNSAHWVTVNNLSDLISPSSDWTIDFWVRGGPNHNASSTNLIFDMGGLVTLSPAKFRLVGGSLQGTYVFNDGWVHYAVVYSSSDKTVHSFTNGGDHLNYNVAAITPTFTRNSLIINSADCSAYIDELRISNCVRWTENFAYPTAAYTADENTVLLLHFDL